MRKFFATKIGAVNTLKMHGYTVFNKNGAVVFKLQTFHVVDVIKNCVGNQQMIGVTSIHDALGHVDTVAAHIWIVVDVLDGDKWAVVYTHA